MADTCKVQSMIDVDIAVSIGSCTHLQCLALQYVSAFSGPCMSQLTGLTSKVPLMYGVQRPVFRIACSSAG